MRRRDFITGLGAAVLPLTVQAQQSTLPVIGFLHPGSPDSSAREVAVFGRALTEVGFVVGRNIAIEYRWADGHFDRLPALAAELVRRRVSVLVAAAGSNSALAAKGATSTIPIVFMGGADPVTLGLVASFNRPGGNATGMRELDAFTEAKRLELLQKLVPTARSIAVLLNPSNINFDLQLGEVERGARSIGWQMQLFKANAAADIDAAFASLVRLGASALMIGSDPFLSASSGQIIALAARHAIPTIASRREFVDAGGLMSYGPSVDESYRQIGVYVGQILKGISPADLPVVQTTKFEFLINLQTARLLGIEVPPALLALADEVIE
jgi:ABC-type uncharacterized transport system substrate-binding protein